MKRVILMTTYQVLCNLIYGKGLTFSARGTRFESGRSIFLLLLL